MKVHIHYHGQLVEHTQITSEIVDTNAISLEELYTTLQLKYSFPYPKEEIRVATNSQYQTMTAQFQESDQIFFITQFIGG